MAIEGKKIYARLDRYSTEGFSRGASRVKELFWMLIAGRIVASFIPGSGWRRVILRLFGSKVGIGVVIKPGVRVKFPWRLAVGAHSWIGESVWIDNLEAVSIGDHCCVSQGAYLCTGNHRWDKVTFDLECGPITIENECWIGAFALVGPGTFVETAAVLAIGTVASGKIAAQTVYSGNPCRVVKDR
ncbi:WcaF family extracellular polysaccharide biosynthesis acetyltransferase [Sulfitobacter sp. NFXS29]|uniref:WcaF family extracellular polysaccharide biosynthesis acetyltransferase n=1 Tax=Sulfitobacter sp. NFXS29 TaxID=2818438 RepID=UPI0032DF625E